MRDATYTEDTPMARRSRTRRRAIVVVFLLTAITAVAGASEPRTGPFLPGSGHIAALRRAFPDRIERAAIRDGDWALLIDGTWYYWAEGRFLPETLRNRWDEYVPIRFYNYTLGRWTVPQVPEELEERLTNLTSNRDNDLRRRSNQFLDDLYGIDSQATAEQIMVPVRFFEMGTRVHPAVVAPLGRVEERIRREMLDDQQTRAFIRDLAEIHGYNWRVIAGTQRKSYHAYGMAVDLVPRRYNGGWAYWRWAADSGVQSWWRIGAEDRWIVPQTVIDSFEAEGFVWGGKWLFFDNVHFEYRPEVIDLARREAG
jgi:hypothetical protein